MSVNLKIDLGGLDLSLAHVAEGIKRFPQSGNPMALWRKEYGLRTITEPRPTVGASGQFRGNPWPKLEPAYVRGGTKAHPTKEEVPVWGGVPRWRVGTVTRAGRNQRQVTKLTKAQRAGFVGESLGVTIKGQQFTGGNVLAKMKRDGSRYTRGDLQLGKTGKGLLHDWAHTPGVYRDSNREVIVTTNKQHAGKVHDRRPFAWGGKIQEEEGTSLLKFIAEYFDRLMGRA